MSDQRPVRIGIHGASGRMGRAISDLIALQFSATARRAVAVGSQDSLDSLAETDVVIDVSLPEGTRKLVDWAGALPRDLPTLISGTTGLDEQTLAALDALGEKTKVLHTNNFSAGVAALGCIIEYAAPMLRQLGYTPELTETHHVKKIDAPSGTAKTLCDVLAAEYPDKPTVRSIRSGDVIGKHDIRFVGADDDIVVSHAARDRRLFAHGAIDAAIWLYRQPEPCGVFTMRSYFRKRFLD